MLAIGRIGVIIPDVYDSLEQELIDGITEQAKRIGYDVLLFSDTCNVLHEYQKCPEIIGFNNIYQLAMQAELDGLMFCSSRFLDADYQDKLNEELKQLSVPCLVVGAQSSCFPYVAARQEEGICRMTRHLIEAHHCRKIYCMTGFPEEFNSQERIKGFYRAMEEAGLPADENMIFYGDFWKLKPRQLALDIAQGRVEKPDAIVCVSDIMAVALCEGLIENGLRVPEDLLVTGYDGRWETSLGEPRITTICGREKQLGYMAVSRLYEMMTGMPCDAPELPQYFRYGTSCGCQPAPDKDIDNYLISMMHRCNEQKIHISSNSMYYMSKAASMEELVNTIFSYSYLLPPEQQYAICLCEDWQFDFENPACFRTQGFSERMLHVLGRNQAGRTETDGVFDRNALLPSLRQPHEPQLTVFISLHHETQIFGYIAFTYPSARHIFLDDYLISWRSAVANGLDALQKHLYQVYIRQQLEALSVIDPATGFYNKRGLLEQLPVFLSRSAGQAQNHICMLISYVRKNGIASFGREPELMIANALRLSSGEEELLCRLQENVFAVILPEEGGSMQECIHGRMTQLEEKIRYIQGSIQQLQMPDLVTDYSPLQFDKISRVGTLIEEKQQSILQKTEAAAMMTGNYKERLHRLRREIHAAPQRDWNVPALSRSVGISSSHFQRTYKTIFGIGFKDDLIAARMEKAKGLLRTTEMRVQEVADACGYHDYGHFMRQFKEKVGMSALQYRKQNLS